LKLKHISRRSIILASISTGILVWGGQTYIWNPFWLYYNAYPLYALVWAFTITWIIPQRKEPGKHYLRNWLRNRKKPMMTPYIADKTTGILVSPVPEGLETPGLETLQEPEEAWLKE